MTTTDLQILYNYILFNKSILLVSAIDILIIIMTVGFWQRGFKRDIFIVSAEEQRKRKIFKVVAIVSLVMVIMTTLFLITNIYLAEISAKYLKLRINEIATIVGE